MTTQHSVKCDQCGEELVTHSSYPANYGLRLSAVNYNINDTGITYAMNILPPLKRAHDFCSIKCLREWANARTDLNKQPGNENGHRQTN